MVAMLGGSRSNPFGECATVGLQTTFYIVNSWYTTHHPEGGVNSAWFGGVEFFRGGGYFPWGG